MRWLIPALFIVPMLLLAPIVGLLTDPWAPFRLSRQIGQIATVPMPAAVVDPGDLLLAHGFVSDVQRYQLARAAGWSLPESVTAVAISIAEDGNGDPARLSGLNRDGSRDLGLWQINSGWWPQFGGPTALIDPLANARAGVVIFGRQGWCAWSTYEPSCGTGHTGGYRTFLPRAKAASEVQPLPGQA